MANPDWGSVDSRLSRKTPAHYEDGVYMMAETNRSGVHSDKLWGKHGAVIKFVSISSV